jgi:hypothetical protein
MSHASKPVMVAIKFYEEFVPKEDKETMQVLEEKVFQTLYFIDDKEVYFHVGGLILDIGCTKTRKSKIFHTLELYWNMKMIVSLGMLPKEEDCNTLVLRLHIYNVFYLFDEGTMCPNI